MGIGGVRGVMDNSIRKDKCIVSKTLIEAREPQRIYVAKHPSGASARWVGGVSPIPHSDFATYMRRERGDPATKGRSEEQKNAESGANLFLTDTKQVLVTTDEDLSLRYGRRSVAVLVQFIQGDLFVFRPGFDDPALTVVSQEIHSRVAIDQR